MMYAVVTVYISQSRVWNRWNFISIFFPRTWRAPPCARKVIDNKNRSPHVENPTGGATAREDPGESQRNLKRICALVTHYTHHTGAAVQVKLVVASRSGLAARSSSRASPNCLSVCICLQSVCLDLVEGRCTMPAAPLVGSGVGGWMAGNTTLFTYPLVQTQSVLKSQRR